MEIGQFSCFVLGDWLGDPAFSDALSDLLLEFAVDASTREDIEHDAANGGGGGLRAGRHLDGDFQLAFSLSQTVLHPLILYVVQSVFA